MVFGATNRKELLDPALTRPGRFDRLVDVTLPGLEEREEILKVHLKKLRLINQDRIKYDTSFKFQRENGMIEIID